MPRNEGQNPKKIKIHEFRGMMKGGIDYNLYLWIMCKVLSVGWNFNFLSKFVSFKGVSPRHEGQNLKKLEILEFWGVMKVGIDYNLYIWIICKVLSVCGNIQFFVNIFEF